MAFGVGSSTVGRFPGRIARVLAGALWAACLGALAQSPSPGVPIAAVAHVDWQRYGGKWYELARLPNAFQRKCIGDVTARYLAKEQGRIEVVNQCRRDDASEDVALGEARLVDGDVGKLKVRFAPRWLAWMPLVWGDYWVLEVDEGYRTALVGTPDREYLWLLSRQPQRPPAEVDAWVQRAAALGFDTSRLIRTVQTAENTPPEPAPAPLPAAIPLSPVPVPAANPDSTPATSSP
ncbi:lipocalin [Xylophilus rhododendri]|uniref:Lipocalin n=1 Tax=Xylophilus rhododendri TaxID=2697032 RepID=A0A857J6U3_9BURK|nr:lipocalin family protein [Xylophilus rhododendri]QHI99427.1 lipocalin [Xylophilus rhododendri]